MLAAPAEGIERPAPTSLTAVVELPDAGCLEGSRKLRTLSLRAKSTPTVPSARAMSTMTTTGISHERSVCANVGVMPSGGVGSRVTMAVASSSTRSIIESAARMSPAVSKRSEGAFAIALSTTASSGRGMPARTWRGPIGATRTCFTATASSVSPVNGGRPQSIS